MVIGMDELVLAGGKPLYGTVKIKGAKNAALPILAACLLTREPVVLAEVPDLEDVRIMLALLKHLGIQLIWLGPGRLKIEAKEYLGWEAPYDLVRKMRASFLVLGPLLARNGRSRVSLPGGCAIGTRPIDLHLKGFKALGAQISMGLGYIEAKAAQLRGASFCLDYPSVGATENLIMAACLAQGRTVLSNCAREPEVVDLADFLNFLGAKVNGAGTAQIEITGVEGLGGSNCYTIIPDRIEAGTYLAAVAAAGGEAALLNVRAEHLTPVIAKLQEAGAEIYSDGSKLRITRGKPLESVDLTTLPYPGFPTDLQPIFAALNSRGRGVAIIRETVFENRFRYVNELLRMGANIKVQGNVALVYGVPELTGARVVAPDLRGGAALVVAGLAAAGETQIDCLHHLDRGYSGLAANLHSLGAVVMRRPVGEDD